MENELGQHIVVRRKAMGFTLRSLAKKLDVSASLLSMIEQGKHVPSPSLIVKLAEIMGADADEWCALAGKITPEAEGALADLAREDPEGFRFLRKLVERRNGDR